jgi:hypothetical protein
LSDSGAEKVVKALTNVSQYLWGMLKVGGCLQEYKASQRDGANAEMEVKVLVCHSVSVSGTERGGQ